MQEGKNLTNKLQQVESVMLYDLLCNNSLWNSFKLTKNNKIIERVWCQINKYKLYLDFIHPHKGGGIFFDLNKKEKSIHILDGECEIETGFVDAFDSQQSISKITSNGNIYIENQNKNSYINIFPLKTTASITLVFDDEKEDNKIEGLHIDRVFVIIEYFKNKFQHTTKKDNDIIDDLKRGDWVVIDENKTNKEDREEYHNFLGKKGFVIKNSKEDGLSIRFGNDRVDEFNHKILTKLTKKEDE